MIRMHRIIIIIENGAQLAAIHALALGAVSCGAQVDTGGAGAGGVAGPTIGCPDPEPILQQGTDLESGFVRCSDGFVHRAALAECTAPALAGDCNASNGNCTVDSECTDRPYGACVKAEPWFGCACEYGCATDADCPEGRVCACAGVVDKRARCVATGCVTSSDCGSGLCGLSKGVGPCGVVSAKMACLGPEAACRVDANCASEEPIYCSGDPETPLQCRLLDEWRCTEPWGCGPCG
jgi:hypothetical protein